MAQSQESQDRFEALKSRLEAIRSQLEVLREDGIIEVEAGELDLQCIRYQELVGKFLGLPNTPEISRDLGKLLIDMGIVIDDMAMISSNLKGPLERLIAAIYDQLPDDPEPPRDAS